MPEASLEARRRRGLGGFAKSSRFPPLSPLLAAIPVKGGGLCRALLQGGDLHRAVEGAGREAHGVQAEAAHELPVPCHII